MPPSIDDIVSVEITVQSSAVDRAPFGIPLIVPAASHSLFVPRTRLFSVSNVLTDLVGIGAATNSAAYLMATSAAAQTPRPSQIMIGRVAAGDANVTASMNAIEAEAGENFYAFAFGTRAQDDIEELALWTETTRHIYLAQTGDAAAAAGDADNVLENLQLGSYRRTGVLWHSPDTEDYADVAWASRGSAFRLDTKGGNKTWANKTLAGVTPDTLTNDERTTIHGYGGNTYERRGGRNKVRQGTSSEGEYIDVQVTVDWLRTRMIEDIWAALGEDDIGFDQAGLDAIATIVRKRLQIAVDNGHLTSFTVQPLKIEETLDSDRATRLLRNVLFTGRLRGFIHTVEVVGTVAA